MSVDMGTSDPWTIQPRERARYEEQFRNLNPVNGIVTGIQVKGYFFQSQLPADVLGQIWALADVDSDGKLDINEFSIACKLITLKLRNFPIPSTLPPSLKAITLQSPILSSQNVIPTAVTQPIVPPQPMIPPQIPPQPMIPAQPMIQAHQMIPQQSVLPTQPFVASQSFAVASPTIPPQPLIAAQPAFPNEQFAPAIARPSLTGLSSIPSGLVQTNNANFVSPHTSPPGVLPPSVDTSRTLERKASMESQPSLTSPVEWGVPHQSKLKYTQLFNTHDRTRTGYLSAVQARNILMQTRLAHQVLAQIWALADTDADGRLSCEEFVLAQHLCDLAREGKPLPTALPADLIPPTMRRQRGSSFSLPEEKPEVVTSPLLSSVTFEDKRKENFDKGQAELDRRRATLLEQQRKEREERERKEREEEARREQLRLEQEARRQAELQKQIELEQQQEDLRRKALEQREAARKEAERLKLQEWERARTLELETQRQREQETVLRLKAKNQTLAVELSTLTNKVKELSSKISETRSGVSAVKATIDGMRSTRDTDMEEMKMLKTKLKEQNQRLLLVTQEKAKLEAKNKAGSAGDAAASEQARVAFTNKQIVIKNLTEKLEELQNEVKSKTDDVDNNDQQLKDLKDQLKNMVNNCESLYENYAEKRDAVLQLKAASSGGWGAPTVPEWETPAADAWGTTAADAWSAAPAQDSWGTSDVTATSTDDTHRKYRAIYEFSSRNTDELSFMPGDIILCPIVQNAEPGWLMGELRGASGWFPESYVELMDGSVAVAAPVAELAAAPEKQPLEGILEVPEGDGRIADSASEAYTAVYPYQSAEVGDLTFEAGERIIVIKKEGEWWTGVIGERTGLFPSNYVQKDEGSVAEEVVNMAPVPAPTTPAAPIISPGIQDDDVFAPAEPKSEARSPVPTSGSTCVSGRETPADAERIKPATPDFSAITAAQTKMGKKGEIATVIAPYQASSNEQLSLARGQLVCIRKKTTTGWWEGELQAKGRKKQVGWFPASYVKVMASRRLSQTTPDFEAELNAQKVIALYAYKAQNEDELTFEKDDVINIVSRDDAAWWKGELRGVSGLFPSNYVMPVDNQ